MPSHWDEFVTKCWGFPGSGFAVASAVCHLSRANVDVRFTHDLSGLGHLGGDPPYSLAGMLEAWHVNAATSGLVWDLTIAAVALTVWIIAEVYTRKNWSALIAIPATFCIGVSCGLPLYLFLRTRPVK